MSGRRGGKRASSSGTAARGRINRPAARDSEVPDVYQEMLQESGVPSGAARRKRRKVEIQDDDVIDTAWPSAAAGTSGASGSSHGWAEQENKGKERLTESSKMAGRATDVGKETNVEEEGDDANKKGEGEEEEEEEEEEEDIDWEDVDLTAAVNLRTTEVLEITLNDTGSDKRSGSERKKITAIDRKIRLEAHKLHLLCLIAHVFRRNKWCNDETVQENLRSQNILDDTILSNLNPAPQLYQLERNTKFYKGLTEVKNRFRRKFWLTCRGLARPHWVDLAVLDQNASQGDGDPPISITGFRDASKDLSGSRDLGAQLFCALLRSAGVTTRLVCSLQVLPFTFAQKGTTQALSRFALKKRDAVSSVPSSSIKSPAKKTPAINSPTVQSPTNPTIPALSVMVPHYNPRISSAQREILASLRPHSQPSVPTPPRAPQAPARGTIVIKNESPYPVYWVEAWNIATQKWVPVDPLVTNSVGLVNKLEPPLNDLDNLMSYVIAFEEGGHLKDVTRRYTKQFNAKTRKLRVNSTKGGESWWFKVLRVYERNWGLDRDQVEDSELANKELTEGIPSSIADLKDHPIFALKRHLHRNQIIHPERPVGSIATGIGSKAVTETVYRRQDVKIVRSPMQWYRLGREIKTGEQPLKHLVAQKRKRRGGDGDIEEDENEETGYYAIFQTEEYIPPAVADGLVPKNSFGNIDVYVPSMVPKGGIHVPHKDAVRAARIIGIDYAEAVTAFEHKGRQASAVIKGVVIAEEYKAALYVVLNALISEKQEEDAEKKSIECLRLWKRFLVGLRIRERIENEYGDVSEGAGAEGWERVGRKLLEVSNKGKGKGKEVELQMNTTHSEEQDDEEEGGFIKFHDSTVGREPFSLASLARKEDYKEDGGGGFCLEEADDTGGGGGFIPEEGNETGNNKLEEDESMLSEDPDIDNEELDWF